MSSLTATSPLKESWSQSWKRAWENFWFTPADPRPLAVVRVVVGLTALLYLASFSGDLVRWFGPHGLLPPEATAAITGGSPSFRFSVLRLADSPGELWTIHGMCVGAAALLTLGLATRAAAVGTLIAVLSYVHRGIVIGGLLEPVLAMFLLYLCLAPCGAFCSLDRLLGMSVWLRGSERPNVAATISLRLMQIHLAALYAVMGVTKLYGNAWWDGEAVWLLLAQTHSRPIDPTFLRSWAYLLAAWTHLIAYTHLAFAPLVWSRLTRPIVLALATLTWLSLIPVTGQTLFCLFMAASSGIYLPELLAQNTKQAEAC
ncbi:MAG TPA: hypothetical protein VMP01_14685 [Pirellulaceae bacterium]|nr:hypothetical protein [Pirellulaceae bacterium]